MLFIALSVLNFSTLMFGLVTDNSTKSMKPVNVMMLAFKAYQQN